MTASSNPILRNFLFGQFANLFKFSVWWISLAPLCIALLQSYKSVGYVRIAYNFALCAFSPFGPLIADRFHPRSILIGAAICRFIVWVLLVPGLWLLQARDGEDAFTGILSGLICGAMLDGAAVSISSFLDVDMCGIDALCGVYQIDVNDDDRNYFNSRNEFFFSVCFIVLCPAVSWGGLLYREALRASQPSWGHGVVASGTLASIFALTFVVATSLQIFFFSRLPSTSISATLEQPINRDEQEDPAKPPLSDQIKCVIAELQAGVGTLWNNKNVLCRLVFLAFEIAVEDAVIVVIAAQCGLRLSWMGDNEAVEGNIWTSMLVAFGKTGAAAASVLMLKRFSPPAERANYWPLFLCVACAALSTFGFSGIVDLRADNSLTDNGARVLFVTAMMVFFFFSTLPKIGFQSLLQSIVSSIDNGHRVFGLIAIIVTVVDSAVIMTMTVVFDEMSVSNALWVAAALFAAHGLVELLLGPGLVLRENFSRPLPSNGSNCCDEFGKSDNMTSLRTVGGDDDHDSTK